jgi:hypothetical protein
MRTPSARASGGARCARAAPLLAAIAVAALGLRVSAAPIALAAVESPPRSEARREYLEGLRALREGRWDAAATAFEQAAAAAPQEEARARLVGSIPEPYLPWHHLGMARARLGRCAEALAAWGVSDRQGVAATLRHATSQARELRARCEARRALEATGAPAASAPPAPSSGEGGIAPGDPPAIAAQPKHAGSAGSTAPAAPSAAVAGSPVMGEPSSPLPPASPAGALASPSRPVPAALLAAGDRFADGDYGGVVEALAGLGETGPRDQALAALLAAAAQHALYELDGGVDAAARKRAEAAARRARRLAPDLRPDRAVFSPRFVRWYEQLAP